MKHFLLFLQALFFWLIVTPLFSQPAPIRWGKVSDQETRIKVCPFDSAATAIVLCDYGQIKMGYGNILIERHRRIKILDRKAQEYANVSVPYYVKNNLEKITNVQAQTLTVDSKGKVIVSEIPSNQIFDVDNQENWREKRFTFPQVAVGSIIEYRYTTVSENFTFLEGWTFQSEIPTLHSELRAIIPEGLDYRLLMQGRRLLQKYEKINGNQWALDNVPALVQESHVANYRDYAEKIRFQLAGYQKAKDGIGGGIEYVTTMTSWEKLAEELLTNDNYTRYLNRRGQAREVVAALTSTADLPEMRLQKIYNYVKSQLRWDGKHRIFTDQSLGSLLESKTGTSAEINLYLALLLREAGLPADPALISTRSHGKVQVTYPLLSQFNHVIVCVKAEEKEYLLDATNPLRPYTLLDEDDLNETAYVLSKANPHWMAIKTGTTTRKVTSAEVDLSNPAKPTYRFSERYEGYLALERRLQYLQHGKKALGRELLSTEHQDFKLADSEAKYTDNPDEALLITLMYQCEGAANAAGSIIYFNPVLLSEFTENPFKQDTRNLPVELDFPVTYTFILNLKVPDGYQVQEMPQSVLMKFPGELAEFRYQISRKENMIQLLSTTTFKSTTIPNEYYDHLRAFYDQVIAKHREVIVLKKI